LRDVALENFAAVKLEPGADDARQRRRCPSAFILWRRDDRFLYGGLIRLHVLHHAVKEPIYGLAMIEELARHGYRLSAGTLYPILHGLEERGYLTSTEERSGSAARRVYRATPAGEEALAAAKSKVRELFGELFKEEPGR
jgi:PadR family transcriptional regulator PadR